MPDRISPEARSAVMAAVRSTGTRLEAVCAEMLGAVGVTQFERNATDVDGKPDFIVRDLRLAVFVDSCFWHGCPQHLRMPATRQDYWHAKIERNVARDRAVTRSLRRQRWVVVRIWEHTLRRPDEVKRRLRRALRVCAARSTCCSTEA